MLLRKSIGYETQINKNIVFSTTQFEQLYTAQSANDIVPVIQQHFTNLINNKGDWNHSIYDLAWLLSTDYFDDVQRNAYFDRLLEERSSDGYWGHADYLPHSATLDTLAVVMAFCRAGKELPELDITRGALAQLLSDCMTYKHHDTVGFELLVPALVNWIEDSYISLEFHTDIVDYLAHIHQKALYKISYLNQQDKLFNASNTLSYSLEAFVLLPQFRPDRIAPLVLKNGAVGLSPAATIAAMMLIEETGEYYLKSCLTNYITRTWDDYNHTTLPNLHPITTSRQLWNLLPFLVSNQIQYFINNAHLRKILQNIYSGINFGQTGGVSWDVHNNDLPDLDDTAVAFALFNILSDAGIMTEPAMTLDVFAHFRRENGQYVCYPHELHPSPASLLHTLMALEAAESESHVNYPIQRITEIRTQLINQLNPEQSSFDTLGHDKWHATWTYGIQRWLSLKTIHNQFPKRIITLIDEVLERQTSQGWGQHVATLEESSYVVSGLASTLRSPYLDLNVKTQHKILSSIQETVPLFKNAFATQHIDTPPIWISKNVYAPRFQIMSAILSAWLNIVELELNR